MSHNGTRKGTHGHTRKHWQSPTYRAWHAMIQRTTNPKHKQFHDYGGRGIAPCAEWLKFEAFLSDMGEKPEGLTLERNDNTKGYSAANCRWATRAEQQRNRRANHWLTYNGVTMCVSDWAKELGIKPNTLQWRLKRWPLERSLSTENQSS